MAPWIGTVLWIAGLVAVACPGGALAAEAIRPWRDVLEWHELHLGRAALEQSQDNPRGVIEHLEQIRYEPEPSFAEADRAAFLLGQAYLRLGSTERFARLARSVSSWKRQTPYTKWLALQQLMAETEGRTSGAGEPDSSAADSLAVTRGHRSVEADILSVSLLLRRGNSGAALRLLERVGSRAPLVLYLKVLALEAAGLDAGPVLDSLARADTVTVLGRELAAVALLRLAGRAVARGEDPSRLLATLPRGTRSESRARHMKGLAALEAGEAVEGRRILESLLAEDSTYAARREVAQVLASQHLDQGQWEAAHQGYQGIDQDWTAARRELERVLAESDFDRLWATWESSAARPDALVLDALPMRVLADRIAAASADLASRPIVETPVLEAPPTAVTRHGVVPPPPAESWKAVAASAGRLAEAADTLQRSRRAAEAERERLLRLRLYLEGGVRHARQERDTLGIRAAYLDSLARTLETLDARLRAVRDEALRRVVRRSGDVLAAVEKHLCWLGAIRHLYLDGPNRARPIVLPDGFPTPDSLIRAEQALGRAIQDLAERTHLGSPDLIARSYQHAWRPHLIERSAASRVEAHRLLAWARELDPAIAAGLATTSTSPALAALETQTHHLARTADSLGRGHAALRARVAREAVERALAAVQGEREAIDYGLAASAYAVSMRLGKGGADSAAADSARTQAVAGVAGGDSAARGRDAGDELDDPETVAWRGRALAALTAFLEHHPRSAARGEMRFRLADVLFVEERHTFRERMARYLRDQAEGRNPGALPVMSQARALGLYRAILVEDRDFPHRDAVLFNAGMLLADEGDAEGGRLFAELVQNHPRSRYVQEAYLRMGDLEFNEKRFAESIPLYQRASSSGDPTLQAIALYKMGWAHFNGERLPEAADAFRSVLDLYEANRGSGIGVDIEGEAESYLVHTLARSGGARAFSEHFDRVGARPYERRVLRGLGHHFRRYSLYAEAAAADELYLDRYPLDADAPLGAQRLAETYQRWDRAELARKARLEYASRFAPGGEWSKAQTSDSVRVAGAEFARASWKSVALDHHREARQRGGQENWREALRLYETLLSHWPEDPEAPAYRLYAGEASARLGQYPSALEHYAAAARSGPDSVATQAAFQRVVVTDAWYESTRASRPGAKSALPSDSLARSVLAAGDEMLARYPEHASGGDVLWRQGHLALAHGWFERAAQDFERLATRFPADKRAPVAASLRADALFKIGDFEKAGGAFEVALAAAERAGRDSLARRAAEAIPVCYYRHAEALAASDSTSFAQHAAAFERVASRWPRYEHAHVAQYRAGLAYLKAGKSSDAVRAMERLIESFPKSEYVKDAHLHVAKTREADGDRPKAAQAFATFAERYPEDPSAAAAWLKAADLFDAAGLDAKSEELRLAYLRKHPDDAETAFDILEPLVRRELALVGPARPISALLRGSGKSVSSTHLASYLERMEKRPDLASRELLAQVRFLQGEEARTAYAAQRLTLPLEKSIATKQRLLDSLIAPYRRSVDLGGSEWANASAFRIGEALVGFGRALEESERPADLEGDDLVAYRDVLSEQAQAFYDRGEGVWQELLRRQPAGGPVNPWIAQAQHALWQRLADRFSYRPEAEFPLVEATTPESSASEKKERATPADSSRPRGKAGPSGGVKGKNDE